MLKYLSSYHDCNTATAVQLGKDGEIYYFLPLGDRLHLKNTDLRELLKNGAFSLIAFLAIRLSFQGSVCGAAGG